MTPQKTIALSAVTSLVVSSIVFGATRMHIPQPTSGIPSTNAPTAQNTNFRPGTQEEASVINAVKKTEPAVVSVVIAKDVPVVERYFESVPFGDDFFSNPFNSPFDIQVPRYRQNGTQRQEVGGGTAFFVSADGLLLTNKHVVDDPDAEYTVFLNDGRTLTATVEGRDPTNDIALLRVKGENFPFLTLNPQEPELGQTVIAIGNALAEFRNTVSVGVISGLRRSIDASNQLGQHVEHLSQIIQTDAAINQGNSGGPLLNTAGEVIGMNTAVAGGAQNIAFAIPAGELKRVVDGFQKNGRIVRAYLGVRYMTINKDVQEQNNLSYDYGVLAVRGDSPADVAVIPGSPADKAGIVENDIILEADGRKLTEDVSLAAIVQSKLPGDTLTLTVSHRGREKAVTVTLDEWKEK